MELQGISKLDLKRRNRMQILKVIRESGPISRVDIASALEITRAAVTIITNEMIEEGVLYEVGEAPVCPENLQKGRRKILIDINSNYKFTLGAAVDERFVNVGLTNLNAEILDKDSMEINEKTTSEEISEFIIKSSRKMIQNSCLDLSKILGIGIAVQPDICSRLKIYYKDGKLDFTNFSNPIGEALGLEVTSLNLTSALALANQDKNVQERRGNYIFLKLGNHFNSSILLENEVMHEYVYHTNSVEKIIVNPNGRKLEGYPDGSVKAEITAIAILNKFKEAYSQENTPILWEVTKGNPENISFKMISVSASKGDQGVLSVMDGVLKCIMVLMNNLVNAFFARAVVLHTFCMDEWTFDHFKNLVTTHCGEELSRKIKLSRVENNLEFVGGCAVSIMEHFYNKGGIKE